MKSSRRNFLLGLSAAGVTLPSLYFGQRALPVAADDKVLTPGEAVAEPATAAGGWLAHRLRGIWDIEFLGADAGLAGLPLQGAQMVLDIGPTGRSLRGYIGLPNSLRTDTVPEYRVLGDLVAEDPTNIRWRLVARDASTYAFSGPSHACSAVLDEVWSYWGEAGSGTLSGRVASLDRAPQLIELDSQFVAKKRPFPKACETAPLSKPLLEWLISPSHRLFHQLWHASRDKWHELPEDKRNALRGLGWQPGPLDKERDARGKRKHDNGSGEDFFFMHRNMIIKARSLQPALKTWTQLPLPAPYVEQDCPGFIRYFENHDGCSVPPAWESEDDPEFTQWLQDVKGSNTFFSNYQVWESQYQNPDYLARMTLGEFGSELELSMHDWLHMRWATVTRDPTNNQPVPWDRTPDDYSKRWFLAENDYLGDPFSSHICHVFWMFHGWIDDRIEDWYRAHKRFHPGEVQRKVVNGVPWFAPGRWVQVETPWLGSSTKGCVPGDSGDGAEYLNDEQMKLALSIIFSEDDAAPALIKRAPRRPWYARNMKLTT